MRIVAVLHRQKVLEGLEDTPVEVHANPTLSVPGMVQAHKLVQRVKKLGPFKALYSSRLARALDTASTLSLALDMDIQTIKGLGQHANADATGIYWYPGHEREDFENWQRQAIEAVLDIQLRHGPDDTVLIVSHRPSVSGLLAYTRGIYDNDKIKKIDASDQINTGSILQFEVKGTKITALS